MVERTHGIDRRQLLGAAAAAGGALAFSKGLALAQSPAKSQAPGKTQHVVVIAFAGGVRTRETFGSADNVPHLKKLAAQGVLYTRMRSSNLGHFGAALSMFTGIAEQRGIRENQRGESPTLFEYLRKDSGLAASDVWIATSGGAQQTNFSCSVHAQYGARYGATTLDSDGLFNTEFRGLVRQWGQPKRADPAEAALVSRLRASIGPSRSSPAPDAEESSARVEQYILEELTRGTAEITGPNAADAKALRTARNLLAVFKPKLVAVVLQQADIAHNSFNGYAEIVHRNDESIGELVAAINADKGLANSTAIFVA
ncbi:MAG TPA: twin-arginine translocation signal domain-containing protein, partial [Planctomycetota bacterium]|nr:twin-arginine translocation signal domain-containing protein [Planctomycetota bacterium]